MVLSSPTAVTPALVTTLLEARHPSARVTRLICEPITGERGIAGSLFRIRLGGTGTGQPTSLVLKVPPADPDTRAQLRQMGFFDREVAFYRTLRDQTPVPTPVCYLAEHDPGTGEAALLLEDLRAVRNGSSVAGSTVQQVRDQLGALARLHARWWQDPQVGDQSWTRLPGMLAPEVVAEVFERAWPSFLRRLSVPVDDTILGMGEWIRGRLHEASTTLFQTGPRTLIHNDVQGDNLFFTDDPDRPVVFIDWQMATYARCVVDVVSAIRGGLPPEVRGPAEADLVRTYHAALVRAGIVDYPFESCQADYELATVLPPARLASAVGLHPALSAHPGAPWDTLFPRFAPGGRER